MAVHVPDVTASQPAPTVLTRVASLLGLKAQGAPEGQTITEPAARVFYPQQGFIPMTWPLNFWQSGYNVLSGGENTIVEACVWAYIRALAQLPGYHKLREPNNGVVTVTTTALARLLRYPNTYMTRSDWMIHTIRSLLLDGNCYWLAWPRNDRNEVTAFHWLNPRMCQVYVEPESGEIFYSIGDNPVLTGEMAKDMKDRWLVPQRDILHIKLATPNDPLVGESWLTALAFDLANRGAMNMNIQAFYNNMSRPSGVLSTDNVLTSAQVAELRERWLQQSAGMNSGGVPILTAGLKFNAISISANDSQLIEAMKMNDRTIAGVFGVPGFLIGIQDTTQWTSTEAVMNYWLSNGLGFVLNHIETAIDQFFGLPANEYTEYDTDALLRMNFKDRVDGLRIGVTGGIFAPNEARAREGLKEVKGGDEPRVQQQQVPLSFAQAAPIAPMQGQPAVPNATPPVSGGAAPDDTDDEGSDEADEGAAEAAKTIVDAEFTEMDLAFIASRAQKRIGMSHHDG